MKLKAFAAIALSLILAFSLCACSEEPKRGVGMDVDIDFSDDEAKIEYEGITPRSSQVPPLTFLIGGNISPTVPRAPSTLIKFLPNLQA